MANACAAACLHCQRIPDGCAGLVGWGGGGGGGGGGARHTTRDGIISNRGRCVKVYWRALRNLDGGASTGCAGSRVTGDEDNAMQGVGQGGRAVEVGGIGHW